MASDPAAPPPFIPSSVDAVVFDIGGVFIHPHYQPVEDRMIELGLRPPEDRSIHRRAHHCAVHVLSLALAENGTRPDETKPEMWTIYDDAYADVLGVPAEHRPALELSVRRDWTWTHAENIAAFHRLTATGMPCAIVSNNVGTAPEQMREHGVCQVGDGPLPSVAAIVDSALEGVAKPDPAIFTPALEALGVEPARALYVGDTVHADIHGAANAGMQAVQLDPFDDHTAFDHHRLPDLDALEAAL
ncbi:MAG: HAD family hydrolase [Actinomycetota bacterium]